MSRPRADRAGLPSPVLGKVRRRLRGFPRTFQELDRSLALLDNADRSAYRPGLESLTAAGLGRVDFFGLPPGTPVWSCTSVFSPLITNRRRMDAPQALREY